MLNVVISFHSSMTALDWQKRRLIDLFGPDTVYIDGGSGLQGSPGGYRAAIEKFMTPVPRSPQDPKYKANDPKTQTRMALVEPYIKAHPPKDKAGNVRKPAQGEPYRVCVVGYSEGCQGVATFLRSSDIGYIDTVVAIDGIHWGGENPWLNPNTKKYEQCPDGSECMRIVSSPWIRYGFLAAYGSPPGNPTIKPGSRCMVLTASDTAPPPCCRQAKWAVTRIKDVVLAGTVGPTSSAPAGIFGLTHNINYGPWKNGPGKSYPTTTAREYMTHGSFWTFWYNNIDTAGSGHWDHVYQSDVVLPLMLEKIVIPRWNASTGGTLVGV